MPPDPTRRELAEIQALIADAEGELMALELHLGREGLLADPSDPSDPVGCLRIWLAALRGRRDELRRDDGAAPPSGPARLH